MDSKNKNDKCRAIEEALIEKEELRRVKARRKQINKQNLFEEKNLRKEQKKQLHN